MDRSRKLFEEICDARIPESVQNSAEVNHQYILSFNFTDPWNRSQDSLNFANVHGSLRERNAFFGIGDAEQFMEKEYGIPNANRSAKVEVSQTSAAEKYGEISSVSRFTKAERSLALSVSGNSTDLDSVFEKLQSDSHLHDIKFFGLSLGDADYPYLKQYFDKANITNANEGMNSFLSFYYTKGQDKDGLINSIDMLLRRYSDDTGYKLVGGLMRELLYTRRLAV